MHLFCVLWPKAGFLVTYFTFENSQKFSEGIFNMFKSLHDMTGFDKLKRFRDSSAQNHFGPGLLGPDVLAHFSTPDRSAHYGGTARTILFCCFFWGGWGGQVIVLFCFMCTKTRFKKLYLNVILIFRQGNREMI